MSRGPEAQVQDFARTEFKGRGWRVLKQTSGGGVWDMLMVSPDGYHLWAEFKRPGKDRLDPLQEFFGDDMNARIQRGGRQRHIGCIVFNSRDGVREYLQRYDHYRIT